MTKIPSGVIQEPIAGLELLRRGKVRDTYLLHDPGMLLTVASDRISIFDFVLNAFVRQKGAVLTAMNHFWRMEVMCSLFAHDLFASGSAIDAFLPGELRGNQELQARATVVRKLKMLPIEAIARGCLTGSGLKAYEAARALCGHPLPDGLEDGDELPYPLFTPTTKAEEGHDEHVSADSVAMEYGVTLERFTLQLFSLARAHARSCGIMLADTKFEFGYNPDSSRTELTVGDEVLTPDSSRFWDATEWAAVQAKSPRKSPSGFDKQYVREWGKTIGIDKRNPLVADDVAAVHAAEVPADVLTRTTRVYRYIFWRLTGRMLERYQHDAMKIDVPLLKRRIEIVVGSESDVPQMRSGLVLLDAVGDRVIARRHIISCHRNPAELAQYARDLPDDAVVVAGAGMAAQLPGMLKALLVKEGKGHVPVIGVAFEGKDEAANQAARLSIEQLPGQPVVLDPEGKAYFGTEGFIAACSAAMNDEFLSTSFGAKPAQFDLPLLPKTA